MEETAFFTSEERTQLVSLYHDLLKLTGAVLHEGDCSRLKSLLIKAARNKSITRDVFGFNPIIKDLQTAYIVTTEILPMRAAIIGIMTHECVKSGFMTVEDVSKMFGKDVGGILSGLLRIQDIYDKSQTIETDNFRDLLLSFAEDVRVILIMIANRVNLLRQLRDTANEQARLRIADEAAFIYAPLAHKLGLYRLKSELEDLSLKYTEHDAYYMIKEKLNATKEARDTYIAAFIAPIQQMLTDAGLKFHIKGRTKSIHSIWQKMKKQGCGFEGIYDLFAIRIILDSPLNLEKQQCWQVYSLITDKYQPNPKRLRDWLSIPKSNGYESLHITVLGPEQKWVEVQIRTERMDEVAERGLAAHWRYKGIKSEGSLDEWLGTIRHALESKDDLQVMDQFKSGLYEKEIFVFSPKGDLYKMAKGSTVLDFAYLIHSNIGNHCTGAKINNKNVSFRQVLQSGDQVEIITSNAQSPKQEWLNIAQSGRTRAKIRQALREGKAKQAELAKETLERRFKNRKIEVDEPILAKLVNKLGFKEMTDFYVNIANEKLDVNTIIDKYVDLRQHTGEFEINYGDHSAKNYSLPATPSDERTVRTDSDSLVLDKNLKGVDYTLSPCCHPIYGDPIFGFITVTGGIKIHREDCPNAKDMKRRFPYRIIPARWSGKGADQYTVTLRVVGTDNIGVVNNITQVISNEKNILLRSISVNSHDGLFSGSLSVSLDDSGKLNALMKKIKQCKGVKDVERV